jgi:hypothetical protein
LPVNVSAIFAFIGVLALIGGIISVVTAMTIFGYVFIHKSLDSFSVSGIPL